LKPELDAFRKAVGDAAADAAFDLMEQGPAVMKIRRNDIDGAPPIPASEGARRLRRAQVTLRISRRERLSNLTARLAAGLRANAESHRTRIGRSRERVVSLAGRSDRAICLLLSHRYAALVRCAELLNALSHRGVLARGFALVRDLAGRPLRQAAAVNPGMALDIEFFDGRVRALADHSTVAPSPAIAPRPSSPRIRGRRSDDSGQGSLFG